MTSVETWKTLNDHILVRQSEKKEKTDSGLYLAPTASRSELVVSAEVLVTPEVFFEDENLVMVGNKVLFDVRKSILLEDMSTSEEVFRVVKVTDIIAVIE